MSYVVQQEAAFGGGWIDVFESQKQESAEHWKRGLERTCGRRHLRIVKK